MYAQICYSPEDRTLQVALDAEPGDYHPDIASDMHRRILQLYRAALAETFTAVKPGD